MKSRRRRLIPAGGPVALEARAVELEGMETIFDDRVSLYPVDVVPKSSGESERRSRRNGELRG